MVTGIIYMSKIATVKYLIEYQNVKIDSEIKI